MLLKKIKAENFRSLKDFGIELSPNVTVLVGPNNSGKSNVTDLLMLIQRCTKHNVGNAFSERDGLLRVVSMHEIKNVIRLGFHFTGDCIYEASFGDNSLSERAENPDIMWTVKAGEGQFKRYKNQDIETSNAKYDSSTYTLLNYYPKPDKMSEVKDFF